MYHDDDIPVAVPVPIPVVPVANAPPAPLRGSMHDQKKQSSFFVATTHEGNKQLSQQQLDQLRSQGYTEGLSHEMLLFTKTFSLRYWLVDNSGSMSNADGNRLVNTKNSKTPFKMVPCSRWKEIQETIDYHVQLAALLEAPTTFRLLNNPGAHVGPQEFSIATNGPEFIQRDLNIARETIMKGSPIGVTPLCKHIHEIREEIFELAPMLSQQGRKVAIIIATDGLPTNEYGIGGRQQNVEFTEALRLLEGLPVWIVIRLCTDEDNVVEVSFAAVENFYPFSQHKILC